MRFFSRILCAALLCAGPVLAQDVSLTSRDGTINIEGNLLSFDGEFYRVDTVYGPLTLDGEGVTCAGPGCPDLSAYVAEVTFSGTRRMADVLIPALIQAFAARNRLQLVREVIDDTQSTFVLKDDTRIRARFELRATTTSEGFADLITEEADIALVLREPRPVEIALAEQSGAGNLVKGRRARVVALDGMVAIVAADQPVKAMSIEQVASVFSGEIDTWQPLGGADVPLIVQAPSDRAGLYETFQDRVMAAYGKEMSQSARHHDALEDLADTVAADSFAIGLTTLSEVGNADPISISGRCGFEQFPSIEALRTEDYPLTLPLMLYTPARRLPLMAREFLDFTGSAAADLVIRRAGFVDRSITTSDFDSQGDRLAHAISAVGEEVPLGELQRLVEMLRDRDRLSSTFRFQTGTQLDVQSSENILRLARALEIGEFDGKSLLFTGFSDSAGPAGPNQRLAIKRANLVMSKVREAAVSANFSRIELRADAFGEALPMACDDTAWGRAINRRVEVWVR